MTFAMEFLLAFGAMALGAVFTAVASNGGGWEVAAVVFAVAWAYTIAKVRTMRRR